MTDTRTPVGQSPAGTPDENDAGVRQSAGAAVGTVPLPPGLSPENAAVIQLTRKDFSSDQEVRWCPGCGDYSILAQTQKTMPDFGVPK